MKKLFVIVVCTISVILSSYVCAEQTEQLSEPKLSVRIIQKNDWLTPEGGQGFFTGETIAYIHKGDYGLWLSTIYTPGHDGQKDYVRFRPAVTYNPGNGSFYLVGGVSVDSKDATFVQTGYWYVRKFGKVGVCLDHREYTGISEKAESYLDIFNEVTYQASDNVALGLNAYLIHWWDSGKDYLLFGPIIYYRINKATTVFFRPSYEWTNPGVEATRFRLGFIINF